MSTEPKTPLTGRRKLNWPIWVGFVVALTALQSYFAIFSRYPLTRDIPWVNWLLFALAGWLFWKGIRRGWREPQTYRGKYTGPMLAVLGLVVAGSFGYFVLIASRDLPSSASSPRVGAKAPDFTLADTDGKMMTLSSLLSEPVPGGGARPRGLLLIFYRGYW